MLPVTNDAPPPVWVGHILLGATDVSKSCDYFVKLGMRHLVSGEGFAVLELRGGTHLVLQRQEAPPAEGSAASFDVMVEDVDVAWKEYGALGFGPSEISRGNIHDSFTLRDPSGFVVTVNSSHVSEHPV
jgi:hypothetical protein